MLELKNIKKDYLAGTQTVHALRGITVNFRKSEFVSILGPSGCGKTTLMNIVSGLDRATSGDLILDGISTKSFDDRDWDDFRNQKIGLVFQSYNLIPHLTVLMNVELSLTISGVTGEERTLKAKKALDQVGLSDQYNKRPNQLSGGQMQRVAIARAIVNSPDILIADEPTGAIDSETSIQVLDILKEIALEKLVVVVTHNAELAEQYSTRIIKITDGEILSDSNPYEIDSPEPSTEIVAEPTGKRKGRKKKVKGTTMSFWTSIKLSFRNLINKKGRSTLTAVAGSIGIIAIALILAVNSGFSSYIDEFERQSMTKYPITVSTGESSMLTLFEELIDGDMLSQDNIDVSSLFAIFSDDETIREKYTEAEIIYIKELFTKAFAARGKNKTTDISEFKKHLDENFPASLGSVKYDYSLNFSIYRKESETYSLVNPLFDKLYHTLGAIMGDKIDSDMMNTMKSILNSLAMWDEIVTDNDALSQQYQILDGHMPENMNEIVLVLDEYNQITDMTMFALNEISIVDMLLVAAGSKDLSEYQKDFKTYKDMEFCVLPTGAAYGYDADNGLFTKHTGAALNQSLKDKGIKLTISGIVRPKPGVSGGSIKGAFGYTSELARHIIGDANSSSFAAEQKANYDSYSAKKDAAVPIMLKMKEEELTIDDLPPNEKMILLAASSAVITDLTTGNPISETEYLTLMNDHNVRDLQRPSFIYLYPASTESKDLVINFIDEFNARMKANEDEESEYTFAVTFSDDLDGLVASISSVVDTIIIILIAVALVSVFVTMLLIAIIMYISVQDRTREIGILRSLGARKFDIANIFNVETMLLGFTSGVIGVVCSLLLSIPANLICNALLGISNLLQPLWWHAPLLIFGAMAITIISGLIPASMASKKDPVIALRTE